MGVNESKQDRPTRRGGALAMTKDVNPTKPGPSVRYLHHVSFRVDSLEESLQFYEGILGCVRLDRPDVGFPGAWLQLENIQVHLLEVPADQELGSSPLIASPRANHVAFSVADLEEYRTFLRTQGYDPVDGPSSVVPQLVVQDPSGNVIEFTPFER
jgi:glyoxylase I family protein